MTKMRIVETILLLGGLAAVAGDRHLRGVPREAARRLATSGTKVFFFEGNDSEETLSCSDTVEQRLDDEYGLEVVRLGEEPLDPVILHEFVVFNETFIEESLEQDRFIYMEDNSAPTHFCLDKLLDAYDDDEPVDVAFTALFIYDMSCEDEDAVDELLEEVDYALLKEESYDQLVTDILDYYVPEEEESGPQPIWYKNWYRSYRKRRSRHKKRHRKHERYHPQRFHRHGYEPPRRSGYRKRYHDEKDDYHYGYRDRSDRHRDDSDHRDGSGRRDRTTTTSTQPPAATTTPSTTTKAKAKKADQTTTSTQPPAEPQTTTSTQPPTTPTTTTTTTTHSTTTEAAPTTTQPPVATTSTAAPLTTTKAKAKKTDPTTTPKAVAPTQPQTTTPKPVTTPAPATAAPDVDKKGKEKGQGKDKQKKDKKDKNADSDE